MNLKDKGLRDGKIWISREAERAFYFYATVAMAVIYIVCRYFGK